MSRNLSGFEARIAESESECSDFVSEASFLFGDEKKAGRMAPACHQPWAGQPGACSVTRG